MPVGPLLQRDDPAGRVRDPVRTTPRSYVRTHSWCKSVRAEARVSTLTGQLSLRSGGCMHVTSGSAVRVARPSRSLRSGRGDGRADLATPTRAAALVRAHPCRPVRAHDAPLEQSKPAALARQRAGAGGSLTHCRTCGAERAFEAPDPRPCHPVYDAARLSLAARSSFPRPFRAPPPPAPLGLSRSQGRVAPLRRAARGRRPHTRRQGPGDPPRHPPPHVSPPPPIPKCPRTRPRRPARGPREALSSAQTALSLALGLPSPFYRQAVAAIPAPAPPPQVMLHNVGDMVSGPGSADQRRAAQASAPASLSLSLSLSLASVPSRPCQVSPVYRV